MPFGYPRSMLRLINELAKFPSVGEKTAIRFAYHLLSEKKDISEDLIRSIVQAKEKVKLCKDCFAITEEELCSVCLDRSRDKSIFCVVEKPADMIVIENSNSYNGLYHILHGLWSPIKGVGIEDIKIKELAERVAREANAELKEVIIATNSTLEGDATASFIQNVLKDFGIKISRIARGLPSGGELEYADDITLISALEKRVEL